MSRSPIWTVYWFMFPEHHKQIHSKTYLWQPSWKLLTYIPNQEEIIMTEKTKTEEIQYLGQMLTASTEEDYERIKSIINRLTELNEEDEGELLSECCGALESETYTGLCSRCLEHASFTSE